MKTRSARESTNVRKVELSGQANGFYTSRDGPPGTGTRFQVNASGTIAPFGVAFVTGSFHTLGSTNGGVATGTLTIAGKQGKVHLELTELGPASGGRSTEPADAVNPRGLLTTGIDGDERGDQRTRHPGEYVSIRDQERHGSVCA